MASVGHAPGATRYRLSYRFIEEIMNYNALRPDFIEVTTPKVQHIARVVVIPVNYNATCSDLARELYALLQQHGQSANLVSIEITPAKTKDTGPWTSIAYVKLHLR